MTLAPKQLAAQLRLNEDLDRLTEEELQQLQSAKGLLVHCGDVTFRASRLHQRKLEWLWQAASYFHPLLWPAFIILEIIEALSASDNNWAALILAGLTLLFSYAAGAVVTLLTHLVALVFVWYLDTYLTERKPVRAPILFELIEGTPEVALPLIGAEEIKELLLRLIHYEGGVMLRGVAVGKKNYSAYDEIVEAVGLCNVQFRGSYNTRHYISKYFAHEVRPTLMGARASGFFSQLWLTLQYKLGVAWNLTNFVRLFENPNFLFHNESSYSNGEGFPHYLSFCCHSAPDVKGSTLVVDGRAVLERLRPEVLKHKRVHWVTTVERNTVLDMCKGSPEQFGHTVDDWRKRILEFHGMPLLHDEGTDRIVFERVYRDIATEHANGDKTFVGHPEHWFIGKIESFFGFPKSVEPYGFVYGEAGKLVSLFEIYHIWRSCWLECSFCPWKQGDMLLLDNQLVAHSGSNGLGKREIGVATLTMQ